MNLSDLRKSVTNMTVSELTDCIHTIRASRRVPRKVATKTVQTRKEELKDMRSMLRTVSADEAKQLLSMLEDYE